MGNKTSKIIKLKAKEYNKKLSLLAPINSYAWLLEKVGFNDEFTRTFILQNWYYKFNDFYQKLHIYTATEDSLFKAALYSATDVTINGDVYEIDKRDIVSPSGEKPWWEFYCSRTVETFAQINLP